MNSKAQKHQIQLPPLLNMSNNKTYIDAGMRNWERMNAPYLNEMISPVYIKEKGEEGVYDKEGNKHTIEEGWWKINGVSIRNVENGFKATYKEGEYVAAAYDNNNVLWTVSEYNNQLKITNGTTTQTLTNPGNIIDIKMMFRPDGTRIISIMYKTVSNVTRIRVYEGGLQRTDRVAIWRKQTLQLSAGQGETIPISQINIDDSYLNPVCNISQYQNSSSSYVISYVNKFGEVLDSRYNGFITLFVINTNIYELGSNLTPSVFLPKGHVVENLVTRYRTDTSSIIPNSITPDNKPYYEAVGVNSNPYTQIEYAIYLPVSETDADSEYYVLSATGYTSSNLRNNYSLSNGWYRFIAAHDSVSSENDVALIFTGRVYNTIYNSYLPNYHLICRGNDDATQYGYVDADNFNPTLCNATQIRFLSETLDISTLNTSGTLISRLADIPNSALDKNVYYRIPYTKSRIFKVGYAYGEDDEEYDLQINQVYNWYEENLDTIPNTKFSIDFSVLESNIAFNNVDFDEVITATSVYNDGEERNTGFRVGQFDARYDCQSNFDSWNLPDEYKYTAGVLSSWIYFASDLDDGDAIVDSDPSITNATVTLFSGTNKENVVSLSPWGQEVEVRTKVDKDYEDVTVQSMAVPTITAGDRYLYAMFGFPQATTTFTAMPQGRQIVLKGYPVVENGELKFTDTTTIQMDDMHLNYRSNSFIVEQNFYAHAGKYSYNPNNNSSPSKIAAEGITSTNSSDVNFYEYYFSNTSDLTWSYGSSRYSGFNYYSDSVLKGSTDGNVEDRMVYNTTGHRVRLENSNYYILYNTTTAAATPMQGISYASGLDYIGTIVVPWQTVNNTFYIAASANGKCFYRTSDGNYIEIERTAPTLTAILGGRYILCNTASIKNLYSSSNSQFYHYASDWNFRCLFGTNLNDSWSALRSGVYVTNSRLVAASQNNLLTIATSRSNYSQLSLSPIGSLQLPYYSKARVRTGSETIMGAKDSEIDIYYSRQSSTSTDAGTAYYQYTWDDGTFYTTYELLNSSYLISQASDSYLNGSIFSEFIDGAGNNDMIIDGRSVYALHYYNNSPTFIYSIATEVTKATDFFVIQGQFYAVIDDKLCSVMYNNGILASKDPIIDVTGMKFIGNNPMIAFFWSERYKAFYSFTGDADLSFIYSGSKFSNIGGKYFYDESTQSIFVPTDKGLLVFGPKSTYLLERFKSTTNVMFSNDETTHIEDAGNDYSMRYYPSEGYEVYELDLESSFYGVGGTEDITIDRWNITFYDTDGTHPSGEVIVGVRSITDITVKSEEKKLKITPDMWDKWSNGLLISYSPKLIKGQGLRLYIKSPFIVQQLTAHVADVGTGTLVNRRASV